MGTNQSELEKESLYLINEDLETSSCISELDIILTKIPHVTSLMKIVFSYVNVPFHLRYMFLTPRFYIWNFVPVHFICKLANSCLKTFRFHIICWCWNIPTPHKFQAWNDMRSYRKGSLFTICNNAKFEHTQYLGIIFLKTTDDIMITGKRTNSTCIKPSP